MTEFKPGDRVCLISGSLPKTIKKVDAEGVHCVWDSGGQTLHDKYAPAALALVSDWRARKARQRPQKQQTYANMGRRYS